MNKEIREAIDNAKVVIADLARLTETAEAQLVKAEVEVLEAYHTNHALAERLATHITSSPELLKACLSNGSYIYKFIDNVGVKSGRSEVWSIIYDLIRE